MRTTVAMPRASGVLVALAIVVGGHESGAYDSLCWQQAQSTLSTNPYGDPNFCRTSGADQCKEGLGAARGRMLSEHTFLTKEAMILAGLQSYLDESAFPAYWSLDQNAIDGVNRTYEPVSAARAAAWVSSSDLSFRYMTIPELAQLPDHSYSLADLLLGNERCLPGGSPCRTKGVVSAKTLNETHEFAPHMGSINSTHFAEQGQATYQLYHNLALSIASRCQAMSDAFRNSQFVADLTAQGFTVQPHPLLNEITGDPGLVQGRAFDSAMLPNEVATCEREALAFEAIASHFLEDAWSSGHMWERWGSPLFANNEDDRKRALEASLVGGLIHGGRGPLDAKVPKCASDAAGPSNYSAFDPSCWSHWNYINDAMCMPGVWNLPQPYPSALGLLSWDMATSAQFAYPGGLNPFSQEYSTAAQLVNSGPSAPTFFAGGDVYLLPCRSGGHPAILDDTNEFLKAQRDQMMNCLKRGLAEVYNTGPKLGTNGFPLPVSTSVRVDTDPLCWSQRATNSSVRAGLGLSGRPSTARPEEFARLVALVGETQGDYAVVLPDKQVELQLALTHIVANSSLASSKDPTGTFLAQTGLLGGDLPFLNQPANRVGAQVVSAWDDNAEQNLVSYYDNRFPETWNSYYNGTQSCVSDVDCPAGYYCVAEQLGSFCQEQEAAIMSVYRRGETAAWCTSDTKESLEAAAASCNATGNGSSVACNACVEAVLPHLRNACDDVTYSASGRSVNWDPYINSDDNRAFQLRSVCDVYNESGLIAVDKKTTRQIMPVYRLYNPEVPGAARQAASDFCMEGRPIYFASPVDVGNIAPKPASGPQDTHFYGPHGPVDGFFDIESVSSCATFNVCGTTTPPGYLAYGDTATDSRPTHVHTFKLHAVPIVEPDGKKHVAKLTAGQDSDLDFQAFQGPSCLEPAKNVSKRMDGDDIALDWTITHGKPDYICIRQKPSDYTIWTGSITSENGATCW